MSKIGQHVIEQEEAGNLEYNEDTRSYQPVQVAGVTVAEQRHEDITEDPTLKPSFALWSIESDLATIRKEKNKLTREDLFTLQRISETSSALVEQMKGKVK